MSRFFNQVRSALGVGGDNNGTFGAGLGGLSGETASGLGVQFGDVGASIGSAQPRPAPPGSGYMPPGGRPTIGAVTGGRIPPPPVAARPMPTQGYSGTPTMTGGSPNPAALASASPRRPAFVTSDRREKSGISSMGSHEYQSLMKRIAALESRLK